MKTDRGILGAFGNRLTVLPMFAGLIAVVFFILTALLAAQTGRVVRADVGDFIPFQGLEADDEGNAAWNADGSGPEAAKTGHAIGWTPCVAVAYHYGASRDHDDIDPGATRFCADRQRFRPG